MPRDSARIIITCPVCKGTGRVDGKHCPECAGVREIGRIGTFAEVAEFVEKWRESTNV